MVIKKIPATKETIVPLKNKKSYSPIMRYFSKILKLTIVLFISVLSINNASGQTWNFDYTGSQQTVTLQPGRYKLEVWGAEGGGDTGAVDKIAPGGKGGYSKGEITLTEAKTVYVIVGQKGFQGYLAETSYNGGGAGNPYTTSTNSQNGFSGGGASHMAFQSGVLSTLSAVSNQVLLVAGGGGAGGGGYSMTTYNTRGGHGGGLVGETPPDTPTPTIRRVGGGGTQSAGGITNGAHVESAFGLGASSTQLRSDNIQGGGGGGGYFGGGAGSEAG